MKTKNTQATEVANLKRLLTEFERLDGERIRHEKMASGLAEEENRLMQTADLDNPSDFEKVGQVRLRRELVPRKAREFAAAAKTDAEKLKHLCVALSRDHLQIVEAKLDALTRKIALCLAPVFPAESNTSEAERILRRNSRGDQWDVLDGAEILVCQTPNGRILDEQRRIILNLYNSITSTDPAWLAKRLLEFIAVVNAMQI